MIIFVCISRKKKLYVRLYFRLFLLPNLLANEKQFNTIGETHFQRSLEQGVNNRGGLTTMLKILYANHLARETSLFTLWLSKLESLLSRRQKLGPSFGTFPRFARL